MDSFFGIGLFELVMIAVIALLVLGPERLPGAMREVAKYMRQLRNISSEFQSQFSEELKVLDEINPRRILNEAIDPNAGTSSSAGNGAKPAATAATPTAAATAPKSLATKAAGTAAAATAATAKTVTPGAGSGAAPPKPLATRPVTPTPAAPAASPTIINGELDNTILPPGAASEAGAAPEALPPAGAPAAAPPDPPSAAAPSAPPNAERTGGSDGAEPPAESGAEASP